MATQRVVGSWWENESGSKRHELVFALLRTLALEQSNRDKALGVWWRMYQGFDNQTPIGLALVQRPASMPRLRLNICRSIIETVMSRIARNKTRAWALTNGGKWGARRRGKQLTKFLAGLFDEEHVYEIGQKSFLDACWSDIGCAHIYESNGRPKVERVPPYELRWDEAEAAMGEIRSLHRIKYVARSVAIAKWPKFKDQIESCPLPNIGRASGLLPDLIEVVESYHLPSDENANDGVHSLVCATATLVDEQYKRQTFPYAFFKWSEEPVGFAGKGLNSLLASIQFSINKLLKTLEETLDMWAPFILADSNAGINSSEMMTNELFRLVTWSGAGAEPKVVMPPAVSPDIVRQIASLKTEAHDIAGVSQMATANQLPPGLSGSGESIRQWNDTEDSRYALVSQRYEAFYVSIAHRLIEVCEDIAKNGGTVKVSSSSGKVLEEIDWKKVAMDKAEYRLSVMPTSLLPSTPSGRLAKVKDMMESGLIGAQTGLSLLDYPDLEAANSLENADLELIDMQLDKFLDDEPVYEPPERYTDPRLALRRAVQTYERARIEGAPEENLECLRMYIGDVEQMLSSAMEAAQPSTQQQQEPPQQQEQIAPPEAIAA